MSPDDYDQKAAALDSFEIPLSPFTKAVDLSDLKNANLAPPQWIIEGLMPRKHVTLLGGHGGAGKSLLALTWAAHIAHGLDWGGLEISLGKVLFVSLEDDGDLIKYRLAKIVEAFDIELGENLKVLDGTDEGHSLAAARLQDGVRSMRRTPAMDRLAEIASDYDVVMIDNSSDGFAGNENDRSEVRAFVKGMLGGMAAKNNQAVLLLAHIDKQAARGGAVGNNYSGSTAWHNSSRSRLALIVVDGCVELHQEKSNLGARMEVPIRLTWFLEGLLKPISMDRAAQSAREELQLEEDADTLLGLIEVVISAGDDITAAQGGARTTLHQLKTYQEFPDSFNKKSGKARFERALTLLQREKRIIKVREKDANRNYKSRFNLGKT